MSRAINRLTARGVAAALKKPGWHADGGGLYLRVQDGNRASWVIVDNSGGRRKERGLGPAATISLHDARQLRDAPPPPPAPVPTFRAVAEQLIGTIETEDERAARRLAKETVGQLGAAAIVVAGGPLDPAVVAAMEGDITAGFRNPKHRQQWRNTLADYAGAILDMRVDAITTDDILSLLRPIWNTKPETADRVRGRIERVLAAARASGHIRGPWENPARWRHHLSLLLPKKKKLARGHHKAMPYKDLPAFMVRLRRRPADAARALEWLILNVNRTGEVIGARPGELIRDESVWRIPKERMKAGVEHEIVLGRRALEIIEEMSPAAAPLADDAYLFGRDGGTKPLSNMAMQMLLRRMGHTDITVHGFRSAFKDWALNETDFADELSEEALAHVVGSKVRRAYRRSVALERRRALMQAWEAFLTSGGPEQEILPPEPVALTILEVAD